jgi:hypothetical protein
MPSLSGLTFTPTPAPAAVATLSGRVLRIAAGSGGRLPAGARIETRGRHQQSNALTVQPEYAAGRIGDT